MVITPPTLHPKLRCPPLLLVGSIVRAHSSVRMEWYTAVPPFCWEEPGTNHLRCAEGSSEQRSAEPDGWRWRGVSVGFTVTHTAEIFVLEPKLSSWVDVGKSKLSRCCPFYVPDTQHIFMTLTKLTPILGWFSMVFLAILPPIFGFKSHNQVAQSDDMDQNVEYQSTRQRIAICHICSTKPSRAIAVSYDFLSGR